MFSIGSYNFGIAVLKTKENETIFIPKGSKHRLANESAKKLIIIELWYGDILDESDIERFEDIYERI